jgi:hypothetical protein
MVERWPGPATRPKVPTYRVHGLTVTQSCGARSAQRADVTDMASVSRRATPQVVWAADLARDFCGDGCGLRGRSTGVKVLRAGQPSVVAAVAICFPW